MLRYESSNQLGNRMTTEQVELGGVMLDAGTSITLCIGAANRDPAQFPDPERFDIARTPNRHLAFATGAHQCAGMALARLEGAIAISRFLARFPNYAVSGAAGARRPGAVPRLLERALRDRLSPQNKKTRKQPHAQYRRLPARGCPAFARNHLIFQAISAAARNEFRKA